VSIIRAQALVAEMQAQLPGYLVPRLVREEPGNDSKTRYA
jgi:L-lysine 2,3-aminomutase